MDYSNELYVIGLRLAELEVALSACGWLISSSLIGLFAIALYKELK